MIDHHSGTLPNDPVPAESPETLNDRVIARVNNARIAVKGRVLGSEELRESESLRRVFRDFRTLYRRYRSQTGGRVAPGLRDAAYNFRADPSLASLVAVAAFLDERDLLS
jgi:hypothetical protein